MGAPLSKYPRREAASAAAVIAVLCVLLERKVNKIHQWSDTNATNGNAKMPRALSMSDMIGRTTRLHRAAALRRSTPRSLSMMIRSFAWCLSAVGVLDGLYARRSKARFFALHALVNVIVTAMSLPDAIRTFCNPRDSMEGSTNVVPVYMILSLFIYHVTMFSNVPRDEWWHHLLFGIGIGGIGIHYCPGPLQNAAAFFISGLPGGVDYAMLAAIKDGMLQPKAEKYINAWMNSWIRGPGLTVTAAALYVAVRYGNTRAPASASAIVAGLLFFNGNYYSARVVASAGANRYRPS